MKGLLQWPQLCTSTWDRVSLRKSKTGFAHPSQRSSSPAGNLPPVG